MAALSASETGVCAWASTKQQTRAITDNHTILLISVSLSFWTILCRRRQTNSLLYKLIALRRCRIVRQMRSHHLPSAVSFHVSICVTRKFFCERLPFALPLGD